MASRRALLLVLFTALGSWSKLTWGNTKFLFAFGDSYTTVGFNISAGVDSPVPGFTSSNGPNWVQALGGRYNVTNTRVFDLASGGATIDAALVPPFLPTVLSIVDQVNQFQGILAPQPQGARWESSNSLFAFWIGINDIGNSFSWNNITHVEFYRTILKRLDTQLELLYTSGARSFLFLTVPPTNRSPLFLDQGPDVAHRMKNLITAYNNELTQSVNTFQKIHRDLDQVTIFDTQGIFNALLDNAKTLGFVNATGYCEAYENGTNGTTTQVKGCAPVSSYFWLNSLHPMFTVHEFSHFLRLGLSTISNNQPQHSRTRSINLSE